MSSTVDRFLEGLMDSVGRLFRNIGWSVGTGAVLVAELLPEGSEGRQFVSQTLEWVGRQAATHKTRFEYDIARFQAAIRRLIGHTIVAAIIALVTPYLFESRFLKVHLEFWNALLLAGAFAITWLQQVRPLLKWSALAGLALNGKQMFVFLHAVSESARDFGKDKGLEFKARLVNTDEAFKLSGVAFRAGVNVVLQTLVTAYQRPMGIIPWFAAVAFVLAFLPYSRYRTVYLFSLIGLLIVITGLTAWSVKRDEKTGEVVGKRQPAESRLLRAATWLIVAGIPPFLLISEAVYWVNTLNTMLGWGTASEPYLVGHLILLSLVWFGFSFTEMVMYPTFTKENPMAKKVTRYLALGSLVALGISYFVGQWIASQSSGIRALLVMLVIGGVIWLFVRLMSGAFTRKGGGGVKFNLGWVVGLVAIYLVVWFVVRTNNSGIPGPMEWPKKLFGGRSIAEAMESPTPPDNRSGQQSGSGRTTTYGPYLLLPGHFATTVSRQDPDAHYRDLRFPAGTRYRTKSKNQGLWYRSLGYIRSTEPIVRVRDRVEVSTFGEVPDNHPDAPLGHPYVREIYSDGSYREQVVPIDGYSEWRELKAPALLETSPNVEESIRPSEGRRGPVMPYDRGKGSVEITFEVQLPLPAASTAH